MRRTVWIFPEKKAVLSEFHTKLSEHDYMLKGV